VTASRRRLLPAHPRAASLARTYVADQCRKLPPHTLEDALLLTSELVGNAVRHGAPDVTMGVHCDNGHVRVEVTDTAAELPEPRFPSATSEGGRGLMLVQAYAHRWGVRPLAHGKVVWFALRPGTGSFKAQ
jgi:anti-sigma regulatory factor (Ser/Thr protein kinase)